MFSPLACINEFITFKSDGIYTMEKIEFWLLKFSGFYKETLAYVQTQDLFRMEDGTTVCLPSFWKTTNEYKFLDLYKTLDTVSNFHRKENNTRGLLLEYHSIKNSQSDLKQWTKKAKYIVADQYASFLSDYLDYDEDDNEENLLIYMESIKELEIYIDKNDFKNTLEFLGVFQNFNPLD